jgi:hypothetical protein
MKNNEIRNSLIMLGILVLALIPVATANIIKFTNNDFRSRASGTHMTQETGPLTAKMYITPITILGQNQFISINNELQTLLNKTGYGSKQLAIGFSVGEEYTNDDKTKGASQNYDLDNTQLYKLIEAAKSFRIPMMVHANGYKWVMIQHLETDRNTMVWDQNQHDFTQLPGYYQMSLSQRAGSWLWSLNEFNTRYFSLKEKNFRQLARVLASFNNAYPDLFVGVSTDSEISMLAASFYPKLSSYDYNPDTILQWRMYLAGNNWQPSWSNKNSPYIGSGWLAGKGLNLNLSQLNTKYGTQYSAFTQIPAPRVDETKMTTSNYSVFVPESGFSASMWSDWQVFKETLVRNTLVKMKRWAVEEGIPADKIYSHQAAGYQSSSAQEAFWGNSFSTGNLSGSGYGINLYGSVIEDTDLINSVRNANANWGSTEWNPGTTNNTLSALNIAWNYGAKVINPNFFWSSSEGDFSELNILYGKDKTNSLIIDKISEFVRSKSSQDRQISGFVDGWVGNKIAGWVCDLSEPNRPLNIVVRNSQNAVIANAVADVSRASVVADVCGSSHRYHGFEIPISDPIALTTRSLSIYVNNPFTTVSRTLSYSLPTSPTPTSTIRITPTGQSDPLSPLGTPGSVLGWLDVADSRGIIGWTCDTTQPGKQISVIVRYGKANGQKTIVTGVANVARAAEVKSLCKSNTINHGYVIPKPSGLSSGDMVEVFGQDETGYVQLNGSPKQY